MLGRLIFIAIWIVFSWPGAAHAKWREAQSDHFVVYSDDSEDDVRRFAQMLESYHSALALVTGFSPPKPSPSNRITIFAVGSRKDLQKVYGGDNKNIAGFYVPRAGGSRAFVPDIKMSSGEPTISMIILLHEYAHHFMISSSRYAMPRWISEGGAEFFASAKFPRSGEVIIGRPAIHRAGELAFAEEVSVQQLVDQDLYFASRSKKYDAFYGRSWLLYHYLTFDEARRGQLAQYSRAIAQGQSSIDAAKTIFGDLDILEKELVKYMGARRMYAFTFKPDMIRTGAVTVREVSEGQGEMLPIQIISQRGVTREQAVELLEEARDVARKYPDDAAVLAALAEAEHDAGNDAEAIIAADRAIAIDPAMKNAYIQKGYALFRMAEAATDQDAAFKAAMAPFSRLNALENDHPLPLIYYYRSFVARGKVPSEQARHALERAAELAPFDQSLWMNVAMMQAQEGKIALAAFSLKPLANNPHGGKLALQAKRLVEALESTPEGTPFEAGMFEDIEDSADVGAGNGV